MNRTAKKRFAIVLWFVVVWLALFYTKPELKAIYAQNAGTGSITPLQGLPSGLQKGFTQATSLSGTTVSTAVNTGTANGTANLYIYVTQAWCVNASASTVSVGELLNSNAASGATILAYLPCTAAGGASPIVYFNPPIKQPSLTALGAAMSVSANSSYITVGGYYGNR